MDDYGYIANVRITPRVSEDGSGGEDDDDMEVEMDREGKIQNFQRLDNTDVLVGYMDEDIDLTNAPALGEVEDYIEEEGTEVEEDGGNDPFHRRRMQARGSARAFGRTCTSWDFLSVRIVTDKKIQGQIS